MRGRPACLSYPGNLAPPPSFHYPRHMSLARHGAVSPRSLHDALYVNGGWHWARANATRARLCVSAADGNSLDGRRGTSVGARNARHLHPETLQLPLSLPSFFSFERATLSPPPGLFSSLGCVLLSRTPFFLLSLWPDHASCSGMFPKYVACLNVVLSIAGATP